MNTPIKALLAVADIGGRLGVAGDKLRTCLPANCPPEIKAAIRRHKTALLELLPLTFMTVRSAALDSTVFWTPDEDTKESLVAAGADAGSVYTQSELECLVDRRVTVGELRLIHAAKQRFSGRVTD